MIANLVLLLGVGLTIWAWIAPWLVRALARPTVTSPLQAEQVVGFHTRVRGSQNALAELGRRGRFDSATGDPEACVAELNRLVYESLAHGDPARTPWRTNWLAAALALLHADFGLTQDPRKLLIGGRGLCSDAVIVLVALCRRGGLEAEMLDLGGHVVARVRAPGREWIADPDFGLVHAGPAQRLAKPEGVEGVRAAVLCAGHPQEKADEVARVFADSCGGSLVASGLLNPRLARVESYLDLVARGLPLILVALGLWLRSR